MKQILFVLLLALTTWSEAAATVCGDPKGKAGERSMVVKLPSKPSGPAFYYRLDNYFVVFVTPEAMTALLKRQPIPDSATIAKSLEKAIRADIPLREDRDLFRYNFSDWFYLNIINSIMVGLLAHGDASLVAPGGEVIDKITMVDTRTPSITITHVYAGKKVVNEVMSIVGCITD